MRSQEAMRASSSVPVVPLMCLALLVGCASPNLYATPRTTPAGGFSHTVAAEGAVVGSRDWKIPPGVPMFPTYQLRYGLGDELDVGLRVANALTFGVDLKWNPIRGAFDLAVAPGLQTSPAGDDGPWVRGRLPLILGENVSDSVSLVQMAGIHAFAGRAAGQPGRGGSLPLDGTEARAQSDPHLGGEASLGVNIHASDGFALQPEVGLLFMPWSEEYFLSFGMGFNFGDLPSFGREKPAAKRP